LKPEQIVVIENGQADEPVLPPRELGEGDTRNRFGFFGQINPFKGLDVLLQALHEMPKSERKKIVLEVHGANLELQAAEYREKIERLREPLIKQGVVQWVGPYQPHELRSRMAGIDWVVVPSIWWENSPMVIQEAFVCGRPLLASDIGGMAEKVRSGIDGISVPAGNVLQWRAALGKAAADNEQWDALRAGIKAPLSHAAGAHQHMPYVSRAWVQ
jgi:glycosyltransferase involved in cell wall biosynthesis